MKISKLLCLGVATVAISSGVALPSTTASAHSYMYWCHPRWVTVNKTMTIAKIKNTQPLCNSYVVNKYNVHTGHHLIVHHMASHSWVVESGKYNTGKHYTYVVLGGYGTSWFKQGIH